MNDIFKDLIASGAVTIYLDDILIMSKTKAEHRHITHEVLKVLRKNKLSLKAEKCEFETLEMEYLGVIISEGNIRMDPVKIAGIAAWPMPTKKVQLQSFLGFTNFYRRFIKGYSKVVKPMTQLTGNDSWKWGKAQQDAFEELKRLLAEEVVLAIPTENGKFRVEADASEGAIGAVLLQEQDGKWRPVAFLSKSLTVTERNYEIYDKELLAIMLALDEWRHYLMGVAQDFEIWTDHQNLQYFRKPQKLNRRQARWVTWQNTTSLSTTNQEHRTRKLTYSVAERITTRGRRTTMRLLSSNQNTSGHWSCRQSRKFTPKIKQATLDHHRWDKNVSASLNHDRGMKLDNGLIYYDHRIYIPQDHAVARGNYRSISRPYHGGHPGIEKTKELVLREYWWPRMKKDIENYVRACGNVPTNEVKHSSKSSAPSSKRHPLPTLDSHLRRHGHWFT